MVRHAVLVISLLSVFSVPVCAESPNLSGRWILGTKDSAKTNGQPLQAKAAQLIIVHREPSLYFNLETLLRDGPRVLRLELTTDGIERIEQTTRASARWEGDNLVITCYIQRAKPQGSKRISGDSLMLVRRLKLQEDGQTMLGEAQSRTSDGVSASWTEVWHRGDKGPSPGCAGCKSDSLSQ